MIQYNTATTATLRNPQIIENYNDMYILLCIDRGEPMHSFYQERMPRKFNDKELFEFLRDQYKKHRKYPSWFTLKWVKRLSLAKVNPKYLHDAIG